MDDRAELADTVVQGIVKARWALDGGDTDAADSALAGALADARRLLTVLAGGGDIQPGELKRDAPS
jgi:hypothetical protein